MSGSNIGGDEDNRSVRGIAASAIIKFNNFFKQNMVKLLVEEGRRDQFCTEANQAPKYSVCFGDLADYLDLKDEILDKVAQEEDGDSINSVMHSARQ